MQDKTVTFTIGRSQVSTVDVNTQTMTVVRDGKTLKTIPISAGSPENTTYNGQMVISEKFKQTRMNGSTVGFGDKASTTSRTCRTRCGCPPPAPSSTATTGTRVQSALRQPRHQPRLRRPARTRRAAGGDTPAKWFYDNSLVGDVVIVKNSPDKTVTPDNGLNGWNMSWSAWTAGSAA